MNKFFAAAALVAFTASTAAIAAVTLNGDGTGFVGKGDVQLAFGWNNKQLQDNAGGVSFSQENSTVSEVSWTCTKVQNNGETIQERERTTTTSSNTVVSKQLRERNQVTGFHLVGFGALLGSSSETDGPKLNSCPAPASNWTLTQVAGDPEVVSSTSSLFVHHGANTAPLN